VRRGQVCLKFTVPRAEGTLQPWMGDNGEKLINKFPLAVLEYCTDTRNVEGFFLFYF